VSVVTFSKRSGKEWKEFRDGGGWSESFSFNSSEMLLTWISWIQTHVLWDELLIHPPASPAEEKKQRHGISRFNGKMIKWWSRAKCLWRKSIRFALPRPGRSSIVGFCRFMREAFIGEQHETTEIMSRKMRYDGEVGGEAKALYVFSHAHKLVHLVAVMDFPPTVRIVYSLASFPCSIRIHIAALRTVYGLLIYDLSPSPQPFSKPAAIGSRRRRHVKDSFPRLTPRRAPKIERANFNSHGRNVARSGA
jgi:hypothetical protein